MNSNLENKDYVSVYELFKAIKPIYSMFRRYNKLFRNELYCMTAYMFDDYYLDYYDYSNNKLVIGKKEGLSFIFDKFIYVKKDKDKLLVESDTEDFVIPDLLIKNKKFFENVIDTYERFRDCKVNPVDGLVFQGLDNESYVLDVDSYSTQIGSYDKYRKKKLHNYIMYYDGKKFVDYTFSNADFYKTIKRKIKRELFVDRELLPKWINEAIDNYRCLHDNFIYKMFNNKYKNVNYLLYQQASDKEEIITDERIKVSKDVLLKTVDDHLEINENYINNLKYIDLSEIDFENVLVSGVDFTDTNVVKLNPQNVYGKDLSFCSFNSSDSLPFSKDTDFNGVNLRGTIILDKNNTKYNLKGSYVDSNTIIINKYSDKTIKKNK